jgi:hypothetical protein
VSRSVSSCLVRSVFLAGWMSMLLVPSLAKGQSTPPTWADKMLSERTYDFGTVTPENDPQPHDSYQ